MSVTDILLSLAGDDNIQRVAAQQMIDQAQASDFAGFCIGLVTELQDSKKPLVSRQMAGVLLKNSVALDVKDVKKKEELDMRWKSLSGDVRAKIKQATIATLGCAEKNIRFIASLMIANLARIELPHNEWPELIDILVSGSTQGNENQAEAALTTLGYVCEEADNHEDVAAVLDHEGQKILTAICSGMEKQGHDDVLLSATKALSNSMEFVGAHLKDKNLQKFLVVSVMNTIKTSRMAEVRSMAMRCLVKIVDSFYEILNDYIVDLVPITTNAIETDEESVALQGILFWVAICEAESDAASEGEPHFQFAMKGGAILTKICLNLLQRQVEGQTEEDWNCSTAGGKLLQSLADTIHDAVKVDVMSFVVANVSSDNWRLREASVMALGCIMLGVQYSEFCHTVAQCTPSLIDYLKDSNPMVADTTGWVLSVVAEHFSDVFALETNNMQKLVSTVGPIINGPSGYLSIRASQIIHSLSLVFDNDDRNVSNCLSPYFKDLAAAFLVRADNIVEEVGKERAIAIEALNALVDGAADDVLASVDALIPDLIMRVKYYVTSYNSHPPGSSSAANCLLVQGLFCGSLSAVTKKLMQRIVPRVPEIMECMSLVFGQQQGTTLDEAILVLGSLAHACGPLYVQYITAEVMQLIVKCALNYQEESLCEAAVGTIGDICSAITFSFSEYIPITVDPLLQALRNPEVDRDLKLCYLGLCGDIILHTSGGCGGQGNPFQETFHTIYFPAIMQVAQQFFQDSLQIEITAETDYATYDYNMGLWSTLCQLSSSCLHGMRGTPTLLPQLASMVNLADTVCRKGRQSKDTFNAGITLIGDLANGLIPDASEQTDPDHIAHLKCIVVNEKITQCVDEGLQHEDKDVRDQARWSSLQLEKFRLC